jgi:hypothetical protein
MGFEYVVTNLLEAQYIFRHYLSNYVQRDIRTISSYLACKNCSNLHLSRSKCLNILDKPLQSSIFLLQIPTLCKFNAFSKRSDSCINGVALGLELDALIPQVS